MTLRFICKTDTAGLAAVTSAGKPVVSDYAALVEHLRAAGLTELEPLFAEPVAAGSGGQTHSWYTPLQGNAVPLTALSSQDRAAVERQLATKLGQLRPSLAGNPLLTRALLIPSTDAVQSLFGEPVLTQWGFVPAETGQDDAALAAHWQATLGAIAGFPLPLGAAPAAAAMPVAPIIPKVAPRPAAMPAAPPPVAVPVVPWYQRPINWTLCTIALLAIGLLLGFVLLPRLPRNDDAAIDMQRAVNAGLEQQLRSLQETLKGDVCTVDPGQLSLRNRPGPAAAATPPAATPPAATPAPPAGSTATPAKPAAPATAPTTLAEFIEAGTAMVIGLAKDGDGASTGTAFFVGPDVLVTNRHVIEEAGEVFITSKALGGLTKVTVSAQTASGAKRDYAVLRTEKANERTRPIPISVKMGKTDRVMAAGYPGLIVTDDPNFKKLMEGEVGAIPEVVFSEGIISTIMDDHPVRIVHTAVISQGNSGGPLVDGCGRVVGVNTEIKFSERSTHQGNYSQAGSDLAAYLAENGVSVTAQDSPCQPAASGR